MFSTEVVARRRRRNAPFEGRGIALVLRSRLPLEPTVDQVVEKNELARAGEERTNGDELVPTDVRRHEVVDEGLIASHVADEAKIMEGHKDAVGTDEGDPEVQFAERLVHHAPGHLREPEVGSGEHAKK